MLSKMSLPTRVCALLSTVVVLSFASVASADVMQPPTVTACNGKAGGAECDLSGGTKGSCQLSKCGAADCLECKQGPMTSRPDAGATGGTTDDGGCAVGRPARTAGPWLLALSVPVIVFAVRRRKQHERARERKDGAARGAGR
jgi:hypothetical protein